MLDGLSAITDDVEGALFQAGCDDALLGMCDGRTFLDFDRQAPTLQDAILSAIRDVEKAGLGIRVAQVSLPGENVIQQFNALLDLRNQHPELAALVQPLLTALAQPFGNTSGK